MRYIKEFYRFLKHISESRKLLFTLAYSDFKEQYLGSYLGIFWAILRPLLFVLVVWFVFGVGFKAKPTTDGVPFILWLLCGFIPWFFFSEAVNKSMNAIVSNAFLVKKVAFRVSILPLVKILSSLFIHIAFIIILIFAFILYGFYPSIYWLQLPYYILCTIILVLGIGWLTSALRVFIKDVGEIIGIIIQFGFWLTPIFWSIDQIPKEYQYLIKLNPMFYIIDGYRDTFITHTWFWEQYRVMPYFLVTTLILFIVGAVTFKRLRPHFGDVL
jgi:ABC-type polysaccharide/polyol phosphate export permease